MNEKNRIKFSLFLKGWIYKPEEKQDLLHRATEISPLEYLPGMKGHIFCPKCCAPLFRSPEEKDHAANGRNAFFAHSRAVITKCDLRVKQAEGMRYVNEEDAKRAIDDDELVVVHSFMKERPQSPEINGPLIYEGGLIEDINGPVTERPIGRHSGEEFRLPSKVTTIRGLCRSFDKTLNKYILLPGQNAARSLSAQLISISEVKDVCEEPRLYVGRITLSKKMGPNPWNIRQIFVQFEKNNGFKDFCLKVTDDISKEHGIDDASVDRIVLAYGRVVESGLGLCIPNLGWGELALLPTKYERFIHAL